MFKVSSVFPNLILYHYSLLHPTFDYFPTLAVYTTYVPQAGNQSLIFSMHVILTQLKLG